MAFGAFDVRFWGSRGEGYCRCRNATDYGSNTCCVEMRCGDKILIFDAGTGLRLLGSELASSSQHELNLFLTHFHYDHMSGLPFFAPLFDARFRVDVWAGLGSFGHSTREAVQGYMSAPYFPVGPEVFSAGITYHDFVPNDVLNPHSGISISTCALNHPGGSIGYRVEYAGKTACYITDTAHVEGQIDETILAFVENADLMIYDATYCDSEFAEFSHFGHSTWEEGLRLSKLAGVRRYGIFHHRQMRTDKELDMIDRRACERFGGAFVAREDQIIRL